MNSPTALRHGAAPDPGAISRRADKLLVGALAAFGFVLPLSTAAVSVSLAVLLVVALALARPAWRTAPWREPTMATGLILLGYIAAHTLVVSGLSARSLEAINHYHELLLGAILFALVRLSSRPRAFLGGLAAGMVVYAAAHWLALVVPVVAEYLQSRYISASFMMAVMTFVLLDQSRHDPHRWLMRTAAAFLAITVVFTIKGRTGLVVLAVLGAYAAWCWGPQRQRLLTAGGIIALILGLAFTWGAARERIPDTLRGVQQTHGWEQSSTGIRIGLLTSALELAREHYALGIGFAHYGEYQERTVRKQTQAQAVPGQAMQSVPWMHVENPHNEYLMQLISGGVVALALFLAWLAMPLRRRGGQRPSPSLVAVTVAFAVGCAFNSLLLDFVEGHFHVALLAWLLAQAPSAARSRVT